MTGSVRPVTLCVMLMQGDGGALEDRLLAFLDRVPMERIHRELARIAPSCGSTDTNAASTCGNCVTCHCSLSSF